MVTVKHLSNLILETATILKSTNTVFHQADVHSPATNSLLYHSKEPVQKQYSKTWQSGLAPKCEQAREQLCIL